MKKLLLLISVATVLSVSCDKESLSSQEKVFSASVPEPIQSKTTLESDFSVFWQRGDIICVNGSTYSASPKQDPTRAFFAKVGGAEPSAPYTAYYPAEIYNGGKPALPAEQTYFPSGIGNIPMYAYSTDTSLSFKNICAVLKISVSSDITVKSIKVSSELPMNGNFTIQDDVAVMTKTGGLTDAERAVTLNCGSGVKGGIFYIAIPAADYTSKNLTITVTDSSDREMVMVTSQSAKIQVAANNIYSFKFRELAPVDPYESLIVVDPGIKRPEKPEPITPGYPDLVHIVEYDDFYNPKQDYLDYYENVDYVCAQGDGTAFPILTEDAYIRFYQGSSTKKGGSYITVRSHNGATIQKLEVGTNTNTKLAYSLNGKAAKSDTKELSAGDHYLVVPSETCDKITIYCMGTDKKERWEMNYIKLTYKGGFVEEDFNRPEPEYGPLVQLPMPFTEDFETGFPAQGEKPSYYKYGQTDVGRDNLQWSTWFGSISWQQPIQGSQSAQLRTYQYDEEYEGSQLGYLKGEFFVKDLTDVEFDFVMSEYFMRATVSYCEFADTTWCNPQEIRLAKYSDRELTQHFCYCLDDGAAHDAKIKIEISEDSAIPSKDHYDFKIDNIKFLNK